MAACLGSLQQLGMCDYQTFNAQGNRFDRTAVALRLKEAVNTWVLGGALPRHAYPALAEVLGTYNLLKAAVLRAGLAACPAPPPRDLHDTLLHGATVIARADADHPAAEDGRGGC